MLFRFFVSLSFLLPFSLQVNANILPHNSTASEFEYAKQVNRSLRGMHKYMHLETFEPNSDSYMPVEDDAKFAYVLISMSHNEKEEVQTLRKSIASHLPKDVKLVALTDQWRAKEVANFFAESIPQDQLIIAVDEKNNPNNGFWARDAFPIPLKNPKNNEVFLMAHEYFRPFYSFSTIANAVSARIVTREEIFVGGNLIADRKGNCFAVDSDRLFDMNSDELQKIYGCKTIHMLNHESGIGDIDEVVKPIGENTILTTKRVYEPYLRSLGYDVVLFPDITGTYRTHVNALVVDKIVFMPTFGIAQDDEAQKIYENLGYTVVPIRTNYLTDILQGSIHCQTMAYPEIAKSELFKSLGLKEISSPLHE